MPTTTAHLSIGFEATDDYMAFSDNQKSQFKVDFWAEVLTAIGNQIPAASFNAWADFPITTDQNGHLSNAKIVEWMNLKLGNTSQGSGPLTVVENDAGKVRYVWFNGERYCEHVFGVLLNGSAWLAPSAWSVQPRVVMTLSWRSEAAAIIEPIT